MSENTDNLTALAYLDECVADLKNVDIATMRQLVLRESRETTDTREEALKADDRRFNAYAKAATNQRRLDSLRDEIRVLEKRIAAARAESARTAFTRDELLGAKLVRDRFGWHKVIRVNAATVSVETGYSSWVDRIPHSKILQLHSDVAGTDD